jgi:hypothetical protein
MHTFGWGNAWSLENYGVHCTLYSHFDTFLTDVRNVMEGQRKIFHHNISTTQKRCRGNEIRLCLLSIAVSFKGKLQTHTKRK